MRFYEEYEKWSFSIFVAIGVGIFVGGLGLLFFDLFPLENTSPQKIIAYTDGVLYKNNQTYDFSFQFTTFDQFVERNPIGVDVNANLPGITAECVRIRFEGAANYSNIFHGQYYEPIPQSNTLAPSCRQEISNEIILFKHLDTYQSNQTLTLQYGMNGDWGIWYFDPTERQPYGHYVPNVIHISPADTLVQLHTNRLQNYFNTLILPLTLVIAGTTMLQLFILLKPRKPLEQTLTTKKSENKTDRKVISDFVKSPIDTTAIQESSTSGKIIVKNGFTYYPDGKRVDSHGTSW